MYNVVSWTLLELSGYKSDCACLSAADPDCTFGVSPNQTAHTELAFAMKKNWWPAWMFNEAMAKIKDKGRVTRIVNK